MKTRLYVLMHPLFDKYSGGLISKSGSKHYRHNLKNLLIISNGLPMDRPDRERNHREIRQSPLAITDRFLPGNASIAL